MDSLRLADDEILGLLVVQHVHVHEHTIVQASEWKVHHDVRGATRQDTLTEAEEEHRVADVVVVTTSCEANDCVRRGSLVAEVLVGSVKGDSEENGHVRWVAGGTMREDVLVRSLLVAAVVGLT